MIESLALAGVLMAGPLTQAGTIPTPWQPFAACVSRRESNDNYKARNRSSSAAGRWQFLDSAWRVRGGIEWIVSRQLKRAGVPSSQRKRIVVKLDRTPIHQWPAWAQDAAFVGVITERPNGWRHWYLAGSPCNRLAPR